MGVMTAIRVANRFLSQAHGISAKGGLHPAILFWEISHGMYEVQCIGEKQAKACRLDGLFQSLLNRAFEGEF